MGLLINEFQQLQQFEASFISLAQSRMSYSLNCIFSGLNKPIIPSTSYSRDGYSKTTNILPLFGIDELQEKENTNTLILSSQSLSHTSKCLHAHPPLIYVCETPCCLWWHSERFVWVEELFEMLIAGLWGWHRGTSGGHSQWPLNRSTQTLEKLPTG